MNITFRQLKASEIDVRVQSVTGNGTGAILLLYKDARCDMNILDEALGANNWRRDHIEIKGNLFCNVSIYDGEKKEWVTKQDVGTESNTEAQKGEASDSFKRACFNWGIGRELYTAPFTYVRLNGDETSSRNGKYHLNSNVKFSVSKLAYSENKISELEIVDNNGNIRFAMNKKISAPSKQEDKKAEDIKTPIESQQGVKFATESQITLIRTLFDGERIQNMMAHYNITNLEQLPLKEASEIIRKEKKKNEPTN